MRAAAGWALAAVLAASPAAVGQPKERAVIRAHAGRVACVAYSPDGRTLAARTRGEAVDLLNPNTRASRGGMRESDRLGSSAAWSPDGRTLASGGTSGDPRVPSPDAEGKVTLWDVPQVRLAEKPQLVFEPEGRDAASVAFSPDGAALVVCGRGGAFGLYDAATGKKRWAVKVEKAVYAAVVTPDGRSVVGAGADGKIRRRDADTGEEKASVKYREGREVRLLHAAISPDGGLVAAAPQPTNQVEVWDAVAGKERAAFKVEARMVESLAFSPDGKTLAVGDFDGKLRLWDVAEGKDRVVLRHPAPVWALGYSPDGKTLASVDRNVGVVWDPATGKEVARFERGRARFLCVAVSPGGKLVATAVDDHIDLWDGRTGESRGAVTTAQRGVVSMAFSPDGKTLASAATSVCLWDVEPGK